MKAEEYYERQPESNALINTNSDAYLAAKAKHLKAISEKRTIENLQNEINMIKNQVNNILDINNQILEQLKKA